MSEYSHRIALGVIVVVVLTVFVAVEVNNLATSNINSSAHSGGALEPAQSAQVASDIEQFVGAFGNHTSRSVQELAGFYNNDSVLIFSGNIPSNNSGDTPFGFKGTYTSTGEIRGLYSTILGKLESQPWNATISNFSMAYVGPTRVNATFNLFINGSANPWGAFNATVHIDQTWVNANDSWTITQDTWNFLMTSTQFPKGS